VSHTNLVSHGMESKRRGRGQEEQAHTLSYWIAHPVYRNDIVSDEAQICFVSGSVYRLLHWDVTRKHKGGIVPYDVQRTHPMLAFAPL